MVKGLYLGLFAAIVCLWGLSGAVPVGERQHQDAVLLADDGSVRSERSTNLSHITGSLRKIQMYVKNWHLQILPDGIVNGTSQDTTDYTILQRTTVNIGQVKIQGVSTCQYLCMDSCGLLYGTYVVGIAQSTGQPDELGQKSVVHKMKNLTPSLEKEFNDECVFNEMIEQHNYNTYSSARYSNARRTMYLALNRRGNPRKVQVRAKQQLGKLSTYARVLTKWVSVERVEELLARLGQHPLRHGHGGPNHVCAPVPGSTTPPPDPASGDRLRCRKRKKRKKKRRRCPVDADNPSAGTELCNKRRRKPVTAKTKKLCEQDSSRKICQRLAKSDLLVVNNNNKNKKKNKQKQLNAKKKGNNNKKTLRGNKKSVKKVLAVFSEQTTAVASEESTTSYEEEYSATTESSVEDSASVDGVTEDSEQTYDELVDLDTMSTMMTSTAPGLETN